jgi:hypothetical protein
MNEFLLILAGSLTSLVVKELVFPYFNQSAKNRADIKSHKELTTIGENVKLQLNEQLENIKSVLNFNTQYSLNLTYAEKDAIFEYYNKVSAWIYYIYRISYGDIKYENYKDAKLISQTISTRSYESDLAEAKLRFFTNDQEVITMMCDLNIKIYKFESFANTSLIRIHSLFSELEYNQQDNTSSPKELSIQRYTANENHCQIVKEILAQTNEEFIEVFGLYDKLGLKLKRNLKNLIK